MPEKAFEFISILSNADITMCRDIANLAPFSKLYTKLQTQSETAADRANNQKPYSREVSSIHYDPAAAKLVLCTSSPTAQATVVTSRDCIKIGRHNRIPNHTWQTVLDHTHWV